MQKLIQTTCAIAEKDIGAARAAKIADRAEARYQALCKENRDDSKALRAHTFRRIYPGTPIFSGVAQRPSAAARTAATFYWHTERTNKE